MLSWGNCEGFHDGRVGKRSLKILIEIELFEELLLINSLSVLQEMNPLFFQTFDFLLFGITLQPLKIDFCFQ